MILMICMNLVLRKINVLIFEQKGELELAVYE
jgi:hypothetical protein